MSLAAGILAAVAAAPALQSVAASHAADELKPVTEQLASIAGSIGDAYRFGMPTCQPSKLLKGVNVHASRVMNHSRRAG